MRWPSVSDKVWTIYPCFWFQKLSILNGGFSTKVKCAFLLQKSNLGIIRIKHFFNFLLYSLIVFIVLQRSLMFLNILWWSAMFFSVLQWYSKFFNGLQCFTMSFNVLKCSLVFFNVLQCSLIFFDILQGS